jgi:hypothetical protein
MTVAVNRARNEEETNSKASGHTGGKQAQGIKTDRSGPW